MHLSAIISLFHQADFGPSAHFIYLFLISLNWITNFMLFGMDSRILTNLESFLSVCSTVQVSLLFSFHLQTNRQTKWTGLSASLGYQPHLFSRRWEFCRCLCIWKAPWTTLFRTKEQNKHLADHHQTLAPSFLVKKFDFLLVDWERYVCEERSGITDSNVCSPGQKTFTRNSLTSQVDHRDASIKRGILSWSCSLCAAHSVPASSSFSLQLPLCVCVVNHTFCCRGGSLLRFLLLLSAHLAITNLPVGNDLSCLLFKLMEFPHLTPNRLSFKYCMLWL